MIRPVTSLGELRTPRAPTLFILVELLLLSAIPVLGYFGAQALLDTRAGNFVAQPTPAEPGWVAVVEPSPVTGIVEVMDGKVTGVTIVAQQQESRPGGSVILVWPSVEIDGIQIGDMAPDDVVPALADELRLQIPSVEVLDEARWRLILQSEVRTVDNPDPLQKESGDSLLEVGPVIIDAELAATFIGQATATGSSEAVIVRRRIWWETLLQDPPQGEDDLAALMRTVGGADHVVLDLPIVGGAAGEGVGSTPSIDHDQAELVIVDAVPFPAGAQPGDRLRVRILGRAGGIDLEGIARAATRQGFEVVQIGNATVFDDGPAEVVVPPGVTDARVKRLAEFFAADTVYQSESSDGADSADDLASETAETSRTITVIVGSSAAEMSTP